MIENPIDGLSVSEVEAARRQAIRAIRKRLELSRPAVDEADTSRAGRLVTALMHGSRLAVVVIALAAGVASAIRNVVAVQQNYTAAGATTGVAALAALTFVLSVEAALFVIALAQANVSVRRRAEQAERRVFTVETLKRAWRVRLGAERPLRHDELPEPGFLTLVLGLAFAFAVVANLAVAMGPVLAETAMPLQAYIASLPGQSGRAQMAFLLDLALALLPPSLALIGGHLTATFAAEYAQQSQSARQRYETALATWRTRWADPLSSDEGQELLAAYLAEKVDRKQGHWREGTRPKASRASG